MFDFDEKKFLCGTGGLYPPEKPRFTLSEEMQHTITEMKATIDRMMKFEARVKSDVADLMSKLTSDNVLFKDTFNSGYTLFLQEVKNEVNLFESNVDNTIKLFTDNLKTDYDNLDETTQNLIAENLKTYEEKLKETEKEITELFESYKTKINSDIQNNSTANAESSADFQRKLVTDLNMFQADINQKFKNFTDTISNSFETFKNTWTEIVEDNLNTQNTKIANAENYMKTNLEATVRTHLGDMYDRGDFAEILEGEVFNDIQEKMEEMETDVNNNMLETANNVEKRVETVEKRMDNIIATNDTATEGNAELLDIRVAADGKTYATAGESVREQFKKAMKNKRQVYKECGYTLCSQCTETGYYSIDKDEDVPYITDLPEDYNTNWSSFLFVNRYSFDEPNTTYAYFYNLKCNNGDTWRRYISQNDTPSDKPWTKITVPVNQLPVVHGNIGDNVVKCTDIKVTGIYHIPSTRKSTIEDIPLKLVKEGSAYSCVLEVRQTTPTVIDYTISSNSGAAFRKRMTTTDTHDKPWTCSSLDVVRIDDNSCYSFYGSLPDMFECPDSVDEFDNTASPTTIYSTYDNFVTSNPDYVSKNVLGNVSNYEISEYVFKPRQLRNDTDINIDNFTILIVTGVHGDEVGSVWQAMHFFKLLTNSNEPYFKFLRDNIIFKVIPLANPVGFANNTRVNGNGVNINRNYPIYKWEESNIGTDNWSGFTANSETETQIITQWVKDNYGANYIIDFHQVTNLFEPYITETSGGKEIKMFASTSKALTEMWERKYSPFSENRLIGRIITGHNQTLTKYVKEFDMSCATLETPRKIYYGIKDFDKPSNMAGVDVLANFIIQIIKSYM